MAKYLSDSGLSYFWGKCKAKFADKHSTQTASLTTSGWSSNEKTVSVTGVTTTNTVLVAPAPASQADWTAAGLSCTAQGSGTLTFKYTTAPTATITVNVVILGA